MSRAAVVGVLFALAAGVSHAATSVIDEFPQKDTPEAARYRGSMVFQNYCVTCHGVNADGQGRAAKLYNPKPANLRRSPYDAAYKRAMIERGGQNMGRSEFMPAWSEELTAEQIGDVVLYLDSIVDAAR